MIAVDDTRKKVRIIGVPIDLGADRRGVDMGPSAIRYAGLNLKLLRMGLVVEDMGNIHVPQPESREIKDSKLKYLPEILKVSQELCDMVAEAAGEGFVPLILGGDHSIGIGSLSGMARVKKKMGVLWFDTHGDFNSPETTSSGNIHGMPLSVGMGIGDSRLVRAGGEGPKASEENTVLIGIRNLDTQEREVLLKTRITVFTMSDIDQLGMKEVMRRAIDIAADGTDGVHVSFDMDVIDPSEAPGVGTPVPGGINYREAHLAMELVAEAGIMSSMEVAEVNPILDTRNKTAELAVGLITSAFGKRII